MMRFSNPPWSPRATLERRAPRLRRGSVLLMVLVAVATAAIIGATFLASATTITGVSQMVDHHAQARQIAESGLLLGVSYLQRHPTWFEDQEVGVWVSSFPLHGGQVSLEAQFDSSQLPVAVTIGNASFESGTGQLSNGILGLVLPTLSGTIHGWSVSRGGLLGGVTSLTVPDTGVMNSPLATDGGRIAYVSFKAGVLAQATFSRTLAYELEPQTTYTFKVDIGKAGVLDLLPSHRLRVKVGGTVVAEAADGDLLVLLDIDGNFCTRALQFTTTANPPAGNVTVELYAVTVAAVAQGIGFDNVVLEKQKPIPVLLTATATHGGASHRVQAAVMPKGSLQPVKIMNWSDP